MNRKYKLPARIFFFVLMFLPFYAVPLLMRLLFANMAAILTVYLFVTAFLTLAAAVLVFGGKKE
jgi:hypothetical protein